ncbi:MULTISPECIES: hypothetical protein [unclassified Hahella]|uniref:hypothetical protein n=1 Tax=unclassified Hahella TaxID=2624107 RepID=UPI001C1EFF16|nr:MULTISPECIES: hypothetical protein [unclassified Hahella]MBU6951497.1 hypothetical protein [Hahella sp. HN01]MDG9669071.1 hypothetical protein [Hahella sp. CR1]
MSNQRILALTLCLFALPALAAEAPMLKNDPKRPVADISRELGVTPDQFVACFNDVHPVPQGQTPTKARERMNKSVLLPCLQQANPEITNDRLDQVMDKYRPKN